MASPQLWLAIGRWLGVPDPRSRVVRDGLRRAQGSAGVALRQSGRWHDRSRPSWGACRSGWCRSPWQGSWGRRHRRPIASRRWRLTLPLSEFGVCAHPAAGARGEDRPPGCPGAARHAGGRRPQCSQPAPQASLGPEGASAGRHGALLCRLSRSQRPCVLGPLSGSYTSPLFPAWATG
jgi:hypothetical protein